MHRREYAFSTPCGYSRCGPNTRDPKHRSAYLAVDKLQSSLRGQLASDGIEHGWTARSTVVSDCRFHRRGAHAAPRCRYSPKCLESCGRCSWVWTTNGLVDLVGSDPLGQVDAEVSKHLGLRPAGPPHATKTALAAIDQRHIHLPDLDHRDGRDRLSRPSGHLEDQRSKSVVRARRAL